MHLTRQGYQDERPLEQVPMKELNILATPWYSTLDEDTK